MKRTAALLALTLASYAGAQVPQVKSEVPICEEKLLNQQAFDATQITSNERRLAQLDEVYAEISKLLLDYARDTKLTHSFVKQCIERKEKIFNDYVVYSKVLYGNFRFNMTVAQLRELEHDPTTALVHYREAVKADPNDMVARWKTYELWAALQDQSFKVASVESMNEKDVDAYIKESKSLLDPIIENEKAPTDLKVQALKHRAVTLGAMRKLPEAEESWKQILKIDPKNIEALDFVSDFELKRKRWGEARKILEALCPLAPKRLDKQKSLLTLQIRDGDYLAALETSRAALAVTPSDVDLQAFYAAALAGNGRFAEARKLNEQVLAKAPKHPTAAKTEGLIHELIGDKYIKENLPGKALAEYSLALKTGEPSPNLRVKMATLLYDFRHDQNFQPEEASKVDLGQAVQLLKPLLDEDSVEASTLQIYIQAARHSAREADGAVACERYQRDYGTPMELNLIIDCAHDYGAAGQHTQAKKILESAMANPRFQSRSAEIGQAINQVR